MREDLDQIIEEIRRGDVEIGDTTVSGLSDGEKCYIALATGQYYLLPADTDPIEAWHRLGWRWRMRVAEWRGWPIGWIFELMNAEELWQDYRVIREALREYGRHDPGCSADMDEEKYPCKCGWTLKRMGIFGE